MKLKLVDQVGFVKNFIDLWVADPVVHTAVVAASLLLIAGIRSAHGVALTYCHRADKLQGIQPTRSFHTEHTSPDVPIVGSIAKKFMLNADDTSPLNMDSGSFAPGLPGSMFTVAKYLGDMTRKICTGSDRHNNPSGKMADEWTGEVVSLSADNGPDAIDYLQPHLKG